MSIESIGNLTDKQIVEVYHHPRNDKGEIEPMAVRGRSVEDDLLALDILIARGLTKPSPEQKEVLRTKIKDKWRKKTKAT